MSHPALARAVSASLQFLVANATIESIETSNASAAWRHQTLEEAQRRITLYINAGIIIFWILLLAVIWKKYKKTTSAVVLMWLAWFGVKAWQTHQAVVGEVGALATHALAKTREACIAVYHMFLSWGRLVAPALGDLVTLLTPAAVTSWHLTVRFWNMSNWVQKGYFLLVLCVIGGVIFTVITMYKQMLKAAEKAKKQKRVVGEKAKTCKDILKFALFQASFLIVGPSVWWITADLPGIFPSIAAILAMSVYPMWQSLVVMKKLQQEKEALMGARTARRSVASLADSDVRAGAQFFEKWMDIKRKIESEDHEEADDSSSKHEEALYLCVKRTILGAREWLAYWSCWPIFFAAYWVISLDVVSPENKPQAYGLIVAMVLWVNIWGLKVITAITPYFFALLIVLMDFFAALFFQVLFGIVGKATNKAGELKDQVLKDQALEAAGVPKDPSAKEQEFEKNKLFYAAGAVFIVLAVISFFFQAVAASTGVLTFFIQWGMGIEAARRVKRTTKVAGGYSGNPGESFEMIPHRLAFWVIQTVWVLFISAMQLVWIGDFLSSFTPFIFVGVIWAGEDSVKYFLKMMTCVHSGLEATGVPGRLSLAARPSGFGVSGLEAPLVPAAA